MYKARDQIKDIKYVSDICERHSYPDGAFNALKKAYESIIACPEAAEAFFGWIDKYEENGLSDDDCKTILSDTAEAAVKCEESGFTAHLLLLMLMSPHLHKLYRDAGIDDAVFYDSLCDLKWKLNECLRMHGIVGTFVANWQLLFYRMKIFSIGRLQYEPRKFGKEFTVCGVELTPEDDVLSVHIPASGKLIHEECLESYALAEKFFSKMFEGRNTVFVCNSWLLFPEHKVMLPEGSRIRAFSEDYTVVEARYSAPGIRPWPIFYEKKNAPADQLPENTALERAYTERYKKGLPSGSAYGVIIFKDGKILNTEKDKMA